MGRLIDVDKFLERVKKDREHEIYLHSWTADMVLERLDSWYAPTVEAIQKSNYENRLKTDMVSMLTELQLEIEELEKPRCHNASHADGCVSKWRVEGVIQQKINALKADRSEEDAEDSN